MGNKLQINWVCLACTAGAPVCFHDVPTSCERDYTVRRECMNEGDRSVRCLSQFKNNYGKFLAELGFFKPLVKIIIMLETILVTTLVIRIVLVNTFLSTVN